MMDKIICPHCNLEFEPETYRQKYCSKKCREKFKYNKLKKNNKLYYQTHDRSVYRKKYYNENKTKEKKQQQAYREINKETINNNMQEYSKKRRISGHKIYESIKERCENKNCPGYKYYGAKGISLRIEKEYFCTMYWLPEICNICQIKFDDTNRHASKARSIDRINPQGDYSTNNTQIICRGCNTRRKNES